jgi:hypothetical protein
MITVMAFVESTSTRREVNVNMMEGFSFRSLNEERKRLINLETGSIPAKRQCWMRKIRSIKGWILHAGSGVGLVEVDF